MRQQPTFYRLDRSVAAGGRERQEGAAGPSTMVPLPPGWLCLQDCNLSGQLNQPVVVPFVLLHPDFGVALIDVAPAHNPEAELILRRRLEAARFESIFPGFLPILHLRLDRGDLPSTETILRDAFAALPPLSVPGGDGWTSVVRRALVARDPGRGAAHSSLPTDRVLGPVRRAAPPPSVARRDAGTGFDTLRSEVPARAAAEVRPGDYAPLDEPTLRPAHPLPLLIMSGVGGLIMVLALVGLMNRGDDGAPSAGVEQAPPPAASVAPPAPPPLAAVPAPVPATPSPPPAPSFENSMPKAPQPAAPQPALPPPASEAPPGASSNTGASATPAPAQRPAPAATDRLPRVTVRQPANLRSGPDGQANVIRVAPRGETFRVHDRVPNGWLHVGDSEPRGWVHTSRMSEVE